MKRTLTDTFCKNIKKSGMHADGNGLYLRVQPSNRDPNHVTKSWLLRWGAGGKNTMGLGSYPTISILKARELAAEAKQKIATGIDPRVERKSVLAAVQAQRNVLTFRDACKKYIEKESPSWKNAKHAQQWTNTLEAYVLPTIGDKACEDISHQDVMNILQPIWSTKTETASRVRARIENILDWATVYGYRTSDNPARWKGKLEHTLTPINKRKSVKHHPALPYSEVPAFMHRLKGMNSNSSKALQFTIMTACRTKEVIGAKWSEINFETNIWVIPSERMKAEKEHWVPLSKEAIDLLKKLDTAQVSDYLFPSIQRTKNPMSNMAMLNLLERMERKDITVHGFRSSFRDWGAEATDFNREELEHALAHQIADQSEAAYQRGKMLNKRIELMNAWGKYTNNLAL